jgi:hypothetical protein
MTEVHALFRGLAVRDVIVRTAVFVPSAGAIARIIEPLAPSALPWGAFIAVAASRSAANAHAISAP